MLTGVFDLTSVKNNRELEQQRHDPGAGTVAVQTCHILNGLTMADVDPTRTGEENPATNKVCPAQVPRRPRRSGPSSRQTTLPLLQ